MNANLLAQLANPQVADIAGNYAKGAQTGNALWQMANQRAAQPLYAAAIGGDKNALAQLAQYDKEGALSIMNAQRQADQFQQTYDLQKKQYDLQANTPVLMGQTIDPDTYLPRNIYATRDGNGGLTPTQLPNSTAASPAPIPPATDPSSKEYATVGLPHAGGLTQAAIDQKALGYVVAGIDPPVGRTGIAGVQNRAISNRMAEIGGNLAANKADLKGLSTALTQNTTYLNNTQRAFNTANDTLDALTGWMKDNNINPSQFPDINSFNNFLKSKGLDPGAAGGYNAQIATLRAEYAQVLARGGVVTDQARNEAAKLIPDGLAPAQLAKVAERLNVDGANVVADAQKQVKQIHDQIFGIAKLPGNGQPQGQPAPSQAAPAPQQADQPQGNNAASAMPKKWGWGVNANIEPIKVLTPGEARMYPSGTPLILPDGSPGVSP